ncbi:phospho-N-acetylmuramoyl-pentapeptide-transferase [Candidatus Babeliales bacterium]|nr:phospho-N-acetylmuramoyl-pentapeptide-transferase [Candidatus Babeliales bacterium]MBP9843352.1 phospho-N-acetylmuramoyl-pentapeptide-transferase [Candidatus Babeliales bacterium]
MFLSIASTLQDSIPWFHVTQYISVRVIGSMLTSLFFSLLFGDSFIEFSKKIFASKVRPFTPESHKKKDNIPTMGGIFILLIVLSTMLLWCDLTKIDVWLFVLTLVGYGAIGFVDDWYKIKHNAGIYSKTKFRLQVLVGLIVVLTMLYFQKPTTELWFPFFKNLHPDLGLLFIPWVVFLLVGVSNAVNLTDGLDGLAIGALITNFSVFSIVAYLAGHFAFAQYLQIPFAASSEVAVIGGILVGASLGFLWFNAHPAQIFMGDVGSLSLGAGLALMAILSKQELLLPISGGLFVFETLSVMAQYTSWKLYKKRLFKMAPIHHHFELLGWNEAKITVRFNIISVVLCLLALITLKIR